MVNFMLCEPHFNKLFKNTHTHSFGFSVTCLARGWVTASSGCPSTGGLPLSWGWYDIRRDSEMSSLASRRITSPRKPSRLTPPALMSPPNHHGFVRVPGYEPRARGLSLLPLQGLCSQPSHSLIFSGYAGCLIALSTARGQGTPGSLPDRTHTFAFAVSRGSWELPQPPALSWPEFHHSYRKV